MNNSLAQGDRARVIRDESAHDGDHRVLDLFDRRLDVENDGHAVQYTFAHGGQTVDGEFPVQEIAERIRHFGVTGTIA